MTAPNLLKEPLPVTDTPPARSSATPESNNSSSTKRLLWIALGIGAAFFIYKQIPQGRRYLRLERM